MPLLSDFLYINEYCGSLVIQTETCIVGLLKLIREFLWVFLSIKKTMVLLKDNQMSELWDLLTWSDFYGTFCLLRNIVGLWWY